MFQVNQAVKVKEGEHQHAVGTIQSIDETGQTALLRISGIVNDVEVNGNFVYPLDDLEVL